MPHMQKQITIYSLDQSLNSPSEPVSGAEDDATPVSTFSSQVASLAVSGISAALTQPNLDTESSRKRPAQVSVIDLEKDEEVTMNLQPHHFKNASPYSTQPPKKGPLSSQESLEEVQIVEAVCEISRPARTKRQLLMNVQKRVILRVKEQLGKEALSHLNNKPSEVETIDVEPDMVEEKTEVPTGYRSKLRSVRSSEQTVETEESKLVKEAKKLMAKGGHWGQLDQDEVIQRLSAGNYRFKYPDTRQLIQQLSRETARITMYLSEKAEVPVRPLAPLGSLEHQAKVHELREQLRRRQIIALD